LISKFGQDEIKNGTVGAVQAKLPIKNIQDIKVKAPSLSEQTKIASVLKSLDDKIEVNRRINDNLEQQAQALYKSWFVDFEPFRDQPFVESELGMIPQGWRVGTIGELLDIKYGKDHKKLSDGEIPVYGSGGLMRKCECALYDGESVLIPRKGTLNNVMYVNEAFWTVDTMFYSKMREEHVAKYVHLLLQGKNMDEFNVGSAVPSMTTEILKNLEIIIPLSKTLQEFDGVAGSFYAEVEHAKRQSRSLADLRDALLPKLMSGEIDVEKVKISA
jgi:type I restriction enzyme S subunit